MMPPLRRIGTVQLASFLRVLRTAPRNDAVVALARAVEIELRVRAVLATAPGIGVAHGEASSHQRVPSRAGGIGAGAE